MLDGILSLLSPRRTLPAGPPDAPPPARDAHASDPDCADLRVLAQGLQRLLARYSRRTSQRHFPVAVKADRALRVQSRLRLAPWLPAELLGDLCHEIAEHVEAPVRQAAVRSLRRHAARRAAVRPMPH